MNGALREMDQMRIIGLLAMMTAGCAAPTVVPWTPPEQASLDAAWTDCSGGQSCVVVQLGCCDHCNGGAAVSVSVDAVADVEAALGEDCTDAEDCSVMGCGEVSAECDQGVCILLQESL